MTVPFFKRYNYEHICTKDQSFYRSEANTGTLLGGYRKLYNSSGRLLYPTLNNG